MKGFISKDDFYTCEKAHRYFARMFVEDLDEIQRQQALTILNQQSDTHFELHKGTDRRETHPVPGVWVIDETIYHTNKQEAVKNCGRAENILSQTSLFSFIPKKSKTLPQSNEKKRADLMHFLREYKQQKGIEMTTTLTHTFSVKEDIIFYEKNSLGFTRIFIDTLHTDIIKKMLDAIHKQLGLGEFELWRGVSIDDRKGSPTEGREVLVIDTEHFSKNKALETFHNIQKIVKNCC